MAQLLTARRHNLKKTPNTEIYELYFISEMDDVGAGTTDELEEEPSASQVAGKSPNFCVLLHGSLKVEGMVALVQLG